MKEANNKSIAGTHASLTINLENDNQIAGNLVQMKIISSKQSPEIVALSVNEPPSEDVVISDPSTIEDSYVQHEQVNAMESISTPISPEQLVAPKQKRKYSILLPTNCRMCQKEIKGQCAPCQIKELKLLVKAKDKQLRDARRHQAKSTELIDRLKLRLQVKSKKLTTSKKTFSRMKRYAQEVAETLARLKEEIVTLTANQLEEKIKHLSHGVSFPPVPSLDV